SSTQAPQVAVGIPFLATGGRAHLELALEVVIIQVADAGRGLAPPAILLILGKRGGQVAAQVVIGVGLARFQILLVQSGGQADTPGLVEAVAAAEIEVVAVAIGVALVDVVALPLATGIDEGSPLADRLPGLPV